MKKSYFDNLAHTFKGVNPLMKNITEIDFENILQIYNLNKNLMDQSSNN